MSSDQISTPLAAPVIKTAAPFSWRDAPDLILRLTAAQNSERFGSQDILTFIGFMTSRDELERHVVWCEARAAAYVAPRRRRPIGPDKRSSHDQSGAASCS